LGARLLATLRAVFAVDVTEELLVRPCDVVGDRLANHLVYGPERLAGARVDAWGRQLTELLDLETQRLFHPHVGGGYQQPPGHERHEPERDHHE
jgi:hypothetical protein